MKNIFTKIPAKYFYNVKNLRNVKRKNYVSVNNDRFELGQDIKNIDFSRLFNISAYDIINGVMSYANAFNSEDDENESNSENALNNQNIYDVIPLVYGHSKVKGALLCIMDIKQDNTSVNVDDVFVESMNNNTSILESISQMYHSLNSDENRKYYASFAICICHGILEKISQIWIDGCEESIENYQYILHHGYKNQSVDSCMSKYYGDDALAFRDISYIVFKDFPISDYGYKIPAFEFEVIANTQCHQYIQDDNCHNPQTSRTTSDSVKVSDVIRHIAHTFNIGTKVDTDDINKYHIKGMSVDSATSFKQILEIFEQIYCFKFIFTEQCIKIISNDQYYKELQSGNIGFDHNAIKNKVCKMHELSTCNDSSIQFNITKKNNNISKVIVYFINDQHEYATVCSSIEYQDKKFAKFVKIPIILNEKHALNIANHILFNEKNKSTNSIILTSAMMYNDIKIGDILTVKNITETYVAEVESIHYKLYDNTKNDQQILKQKFEIKGTIISKGQNTDFNRDSYLLEVASREILKNIQIIEIPTLSNHTNISVTLLFLSDIYIYSNYYFYLTVKQNNSFTKEGMLVSVSKNSVVGKVVKVHQNVSTEANCLIDINSFFLIESKFDIEINCIDNIFDDGQYAIVGFEMLKYGLCVKLSSEEIESLNLNSSNIYKISYLIRGVNNSQQYINTHKINELFVMLCDSNDTADIDMYYSNSPLYDNSNANVFLEEIDETLDFEHISHSQHNIDDSRISLSQYSDFINQSGIVDIYDSSTLFETINTSVVDNNTSIQNNSNMVLQNNLYGSLNVAGNDDSVYSGNSIYVNNHAVGNSLERKNTKYSIADLYSEYSKEIEIHGRYIQTPPPHIHNITYFRRDKTLKISWYFFDIKDTWLEIKSNNYEGFHIAVYKNDNKDLDIDMRYEIDDSSLLSKENVMIYKTYCSIKMLESNCDSPRFYEQNMKINSIKPDDIYILSIQTIGKISILNSKKYFVRFKT